MGPQRFCLGQSISATIRFDLKPGFRESMVAMIDGTIASATCPSGLASKIRGKAGWAASTVHGKCGRIGQYPLLHISSLIRLHLTSS